MEGEREGGKRERGRGGEGETRKRKSVIYYITCSREVHTHVHVHVNGREIVKAEGKKESERLKLSTINYAQQTYQYIVHTCIRIVCVLLEGI